MKHAIAMLVVCATSLCAMAQNAAGLKVPAKSQTQDKPSKSMPSQQSGAQPTLPVQDHGELFKYPTFEGRMPCDDGVTVNVVEDKKKPHHYEVSLGRSHYKTQRVPTDSGAVRLEDKAQGIVWLQMANKSMLLNERLGKRLATNCRNDSQVAAEKALLLSTAPTVLDGLNTNSDKPSDIAAVAPHSLPSRQSAENPQTESADKLPTLTIPNSENKKP